MSSVPVFETKYWNTDGCKSRLRYLSPLIIASLNNLASISIVTLKNSAQMKFSRNLSSRRKVYQFFWTRGICPNFSKKNNDLHCAVFWNVLGLSVSGFKWNYLMRHGTVITVECCMYCSSLRQTEAVYCKLLDHCLVPNTGFAPHYRYYVK